MATSTQEELAEQMLNFIQDHRASLECGRAEVSASSGARNDSEEAELMERSDDVVSGAALTNSFRERRFRRRTQSRFLYKRRRSLLDI